jgi:hypothetical protein
VRLGGAGHGAPGRAPGIRASDGSLPGLAVLRCGQTIDMADTPSTSTKDVRDAVRDAMGKDGA